MTTSGWNEQVVEEFRANEGRVGGMFEGANMIILHHRGRRSGTEYLAPVVFFTPDDLGEDAAAGTRYIVASAAGAPKNPQWYDNLTAAGQITVEVGTQTFEVDVEDLAGDEHDRVLTAIKTKAPGFGEYETKIAGARVMPVLALRPAA